MPVKIVFRCVFVVALVFALSNVQEAKAQRRGGGRMGPQGVNPLGIVGNEAVQKDLGLKPEQTDKVKDIAQDAQDESREQITNSGIDFAGLRDLSADERAKRMTEIQAKMAEVQKVVNDKFMPKLAEVLDKGQMTRLHEIAIQAAGANALSDASVVKTLALTKEQQDKIKSVVADFGKKQRELFTGGGDREERMAKLTQLREEEAVKTTEVLTKDQQEQFTKLKGKPFDTKALRPTGRRRRDN